MEQLPKEETGVRFQKIINSPINLLLGSFQSLRSYYQKMVSLLKRLTIAQKLYLFALLLLMSPDYLGLVVIITVVALTLEFWPLFERVWHSLSGKAVLLLFYAVIANFAIAGAASVVNEVVGVSSTHFSYTHNFAILLYLPAWVIAMTALAILLLQIAVPIYLVFLLMLKPFGIKGLRLTNHDHFRFSTMLVRVILASIVLYHLVLLVNLDDEFNDDVALTDENKAVVVENVHNEIIESFNQTKHLPAGMKLINDDLSIGLSLPSEETKKSNEELYKNARSDYESIVRHLIATFAFYLESDTKSRCKMEQDTNVVELNDYEILEIKEDSEADYGYRFVVKKCISPAFPAVS
ncbi:hypothetical protein [Shewanella nanhaiensis]|uniref:Uncharacterized protein n=1 Tax=Shewanella nanhaiensis TaxID=2864872 RepID=A0ABS7EAL4_9GAMM|nr:hypothetical protein [Shewanella nanhaiensis]MBW8186610.1 hypothetical protein [Shewanella nanhaiensis]